MKCISKRQTGKKTVHGTRPNTWNYVHIGHPDAVLTSKIAVCTIYVPRM
jgi:hypothetical protein